MMDLSALSDAELAALRIDVAVEMERRAVPAQIDNLLRVSLAGEGQQSGDPWRQPTGAHDAYPMGWFVTHEGKTWESATPGNVWEPPTGWREVVGTPGTYPAWVQPTGSMDAYPYGFEVTHNAKFWRSTVPDNTWEPGVYGWDEFGSGPEVEPYPAWVQPVGSEDAYPMGAEVTHNSLFWRSTVDNNVWEPGVSGWDQFEASEG